MTNENKELNPIAVQIGRNIRYHRRIKDLSQKELGNALNITSQQIHKYEGGYNDISFIKLFQIAEILQVEIDDLISGAEYKFLNEEKEKHFFKMIKKIRNLSEEELHQVEKFIDGVLR